MSRNNKQWNTVDENTLKTLFDKKVPYSNIAKTLNRSVDAVQARVVKKLIVPQFDKQYIKNYRNYFVESYANYYKINTKDFSRYLMYAGFPEEHKTDIETDTSSTDSDDYLTDTDTSSSTTSSNSAEILEYLKILESKINVLSRKIDRMSKKL
jgi:hypothetical protein